MSGAEQAAHALPDGVNAVLHAATAPVSLEAVEPDEVVAGDPAQGFVEIGTIGGAETGIWELRGGTVTDTEVDELFVVLSGSALIELLSEPGAAANAEPRTVEVAAGDVMRLVAGTRTRWTVGDHIRKIYIAG